MMLTDLMDEPIPTTSAMLGHLLLFVAPRANRNELYEMMRMTGAAYSALEAQVQATSPPPEAEPPRKRGRKPKASNGEARTEGARGGLFPSDPEPAAADEHQG